MPPTANLRPTITCPRAPDVRSACLVRIGSKALAGDRCRTCRTTPDVELRNLAQRYPPAAWAYLETPNYAAERADALKTTVREYVDSQKDDEPT